MSIKWIFAVCLIAVSKSIYGNTGSDVLQSCPNKCDLLHDIQSIMLLVKTEIQAVQKLINTETQNVRQLVNQETQALRQLLNQESSLRMGIDSQLQELRKTVTDGLTDARQTIEQMNSSLESSSSSQQTRLQDEISKVTEQLEKLDGSVQDTDVRLGMAENTTNDGLLEVRQNLQLINSSLVSSSSLQQTRLQGELSKVTGKLENLERSALETDTRLVRTENSITAIQSGNNNTKQVLTSVQRNIQALNQTSNQLQGNYCEQ